MATHREARTPGYAYVEPMPWPKDVPKVEELGASSAPLKSISYFLGDYCKEYTEDFMLCKNENRDPEHCLKEGRRVTRCAQDLVKKLGEKCGKEWDEHWKCLELNNQEYMPCRKYERPLNKCVFDQLVRIHHPALSYAKRLAKRIPGAPEDKPQIHEKTNPVVSRLQK
ncbi:hypothetical protein MVES_000692 [Malassezia vespertilionis]|uniref:NADH-ubiquinone oxidoreductase n=1 Tax=Malassezia vespertilionis TaxID=2020962 RepID=A0A2N1JFT7_9BASI|nr:hypothetical protein MVES_000692 [Malassezia vespertilionis]